MDTYARTRIHTHTVTYVWRRIQLKKDDPLRIALNQKTTTMINSLFLYKDKKNK